jgi:hypothetical protein
VFSLGDFAGVSDRGRAAVSFFCSYEVERRYLGGLTGYLRSYWTLNDHAKEGYGWEGKGGGGSGPQLPQKPRRGFLARGQAGLVINKLQGEHQIKPRSLATGSVAEEGWAFDA